MTTFVVLLRGVNVAGHNKVPMAEFRAALGKAGYDAVQTYGNSGNAVVQGSGEAGAVESEVEALLAKRFKVEVPVLVRTADQWATYSKGHPFARTADPKFVQLALAKSPPKPTCSADILARATLGETPKVLGDAVWIHFVQGVGKSKLTPAALDKAAGSPLTMRNWTTVQELARLAGVA